MISFIFCSDLEGRHLVSHSTDLHSIASNECFNLYLCLVSKQLCLSQPGPSHLLWWRWPPMQNGFKGPMLILICLLTLRSESHIARAGKLRATPRWCPGASCEIEGIIQALVGGGICLVKVRGQAGSIITTACGSSGRSAYWPFVDKSSLNRLVPAGRDELFTEGASQGWGTRVSGVGGDGLSWPGPSSYLDRWFKACQSQAWNFWAHELF